MPGPYAVRVRTPDGWQDVAIIGPVGPPGVPLRTVGSLPSPGTTGDMVLFTQAPSPTPTPWFYDGTAWRQVGTGAGGGYAFSWFIGEAGL